MSPGSLVEILEADLGSGDHRLAPGAHFAVGSVVGAVELGVALAQQPEGVLVVAEPQVQAVFLDATVRAAARAPLPPSRQPRWYTVIVSNSVAAIPARSARGRGHTRHPAAEDGDAPLAAAHTSDAITAGRVDVGRRRVLLDAAQCGFDQRIGRHALQRVQVERDAELEWPGALLAGEMQRRAQRSPPEGRVGSRYATRRIVSAS